MIIVVLLSLILISAVSSIGGLATYLFGLGFWGGFCITFVIVSIVGYLWNQLILKRYDLTAKLIEQDKTPQWTKFQLQCAYCKFISNVSISLDIDNEFKCPNCNQQNKVYIRINTARTVNPIQAENVVPSSPPPKDKIQTKTGVNVVVGSHDNIEFKGN